MKLSIALIAITFALPALARDILLRDYNYNVTDISTRGLTKERLFEQMERSFLKLNSSICSNRALVWAFNFERYFSINTAKLFLFYTDKTGEAGDKTWWYHVTPLVNENGELWALDAGFPSFVRTPLTPNAWLTKFAGSANCKEILPGEDDLIEKMFSKRRFPSVTRYGTYDCYYRITSAPYWTPSTVAQELLGRNRSGVPGQYTRDRILPDEVLQSCIEASTTPIGGFLSRPGKKCREYLGFPAEE